MKSKRDAILDTALTLFSTHGYHSVGVDRIKEEAGVSKMTLYKYFPTKEVLIESVLLQRDQLFRDSLDQAVAGVTDCLGKVQAVFAWHDQWFRCGDFHGCMFIKASEEFPDAGSEIRRISKQHKEYVRHTLQKILESGSIKDAELLAQHLLIVLEGIIVSANMFSDRGCVDASWQIVNEMLSQRLPPPADLSSAPCL